MPLTLIVRSRPEAAGPDVATEPAELSLTFDAPRLVIGRGEGAELRLPDPSVSARHASIRARGAEYVLMDEGSTNGTYLGKVKLSPQSPLVLKTGERLRVGRIWLEVRMGAGVATRAPATAAKALALELVSRALAAEGEDARPRVQVVEGPELSRSLCLAEQGRVYVIGRKQESDLCLENPTTARRHCSLEVAHGEVVVRDLGSSGGIFLDGARADGGIWRPGQILWVGSNRLSLTHPAAEALGELERSPDERIGPAEPEIEEPPSPTAPAASAASEKAVGGRGQSTAAAVDPELSPTPPDALASRGWNLTDGAVLFVSLGVLALSIAGLIWLFRR